MLRSPAHFAHLQDLKTYPQKVCKLFFICNPAHFACPCFPNPALFVCPRFLNPALFRVPASWVLPLQCQEAGTHKMSWIQEAGTRKKSRIQKAGTSKKSWIWEAGTRKMSWISNDNMNLFTLLLFLICLRATQKIIKNMFFMPGLSAFECDPLPLKWILIKILF